MLKELRDKLAVIAKQMRDMHNGAEEEDRGFSAEELQTWNNLLTDYEGLEKRIEVAEKVERMEKTPTGQLAGALPDLGDGGGDGDGDGDGDAEIRTFADGRALDSYASAYNVYLREGSGALSREQRDLLNRYQAEMETRAQGVATDAAGGFTVPEGFAGFITEAMKDFSGLLQAANPAGTAGPQLLRTASGNLIPFPTNDDTANAGAILAENTQVSEQDFVFGARNLTAFMYTSLLVRVSLQLLQDEAVNLEAYIGRMLGKRIGRALSPHFAVGAGTTEPTGLATAATDGAVDISVGAGITFNDLVDFEHALDPAYRRRGASWVFNDNTLRDLKKLVDGNARPLWLPASLGSIADTLSRPTLNGYNYIVDQGMQDLAIGDRPIAFGDLSEFLIREVLGINLFRFNERYMDFLQIGFLAFARFDSNLIDTSAVVTDIAVA
jgi:HK97 family phage major capsid protein